MSGSRPWSARRRGTAGTRRCRLRPMTCRAAVSRGARRSGRERSGTGGSSRAARGRPCGGRSRTAPRIITRGGNATAAGTWRRRLTWALPAHISRTRSRPAPAERVQHDLHASQCACGQEHAAPRPPGVPDAPLSIGPRLRALAVYLVVFQHVPGDRCRGLLPAAPGPAASAGFIHSCLRQAAGLAAEVVRLIRTLITAAAVAGFDENTLRSGPAGEKKYVHGAFTEEYS